MAIEYNIQLLQLLFCAPQVLKNLGAIHARVRLATAKRAALRASGSLIFADHKHFQERTWKELLGVRPGPQKKGPKFDPSYGRQVWVSASGAVPICLCVFCCIWSALQQH